MFYSEGKLQVEDGIPQIVRDELNRYGYKLAELHEPLGGGQLIWIDWEKGMLTGGSGPPKDDCAMSY